MFQFLKLSLNKQTKKQPVCWYALVNPSAEKAETGGSLRLAGQPSQSNQPASGQWETDTERLNGTSCLEPGTVPGLPRPLLLHASLLCSVPLATERLTLQSTSHLSPRINLAYSAICIQFSVCFCPQQGSQGMNQRHTLRAFEVSFHGDLSLPRTARINSYLLPGHGRAYLETHHS